MWYECHKVVDVLNTWSDLELLYHKVSGRPLNIQMQRKSLIIAIALPILSSFSVVITHVTMVDFRLDQVLPYCKY